MPNFENFLDYFRFLTHNYFEHIKDTGIQKVNIRKIAARIFYIDCKILPIHPNKNTIKDPIAPMIHKVFELGDQEDNKNDNKYYYDIIKKLYRNSDSSSKLFDLLNYHDIEMKMEYLEPTSEEINSKTNNIEIKNIEGESLEFNNPIEHRIYIFKDLENHKELLLESKNILKEVINSSGFVSVGLEYFGQKDTLQILNSFNNEIVNLFYQKIKQLYSLKISDLNIETKESEKMN